jgi:hypothetical protein
MISTVTFYEITCDGCEDEICAPRAQDYWSSLADAEDGAEFGGWVYTPERQLCWRCAEQ